VSRELYDRAVAISERAYAPYSNYLVGAAVRTRDGKVFEGVNVENAAYPLGVCAEKSALVRAVSAGYRPGDIAAIGITAFSGVIAYAIHGDVDVGYAALVGLPAAGSVGFATALQQRLHTRTVELLFAGFVFAVAVWLFVK